MEKIDYLSVMFNKRTKNKIYENFIVNTIYALIDNSNLTPITQQAVKCNGNLYKFDLYFPQINYGIEIDEKQHENEKNKEADRERTQNIINKINCTPKRIKIYDTNKKKKDYAEIYREIKIIVKEIKEIIKSKKIKWKDNDILKEEIKTKKEFNINDDVSYENITEIYNILGHNKRLRRCCVKLNKKYKLWVPYLLRIKDSKKITKNGWENTLNEDENVITEIGKDYPKYKNRIKDEIEKEISRVVFMHMDNSFGMKCIKFLGVYKINKVRDIDGDKYKVTYTRKSTNVKFEDLYKIK